MEIEEAILALPPDELEKLAGWWERHQAAKNSKRAALEATAGYLEPVDDDFVEAVAEAGREVVR